MLLLFDYDGVIVDSFDVLLDLCRQSQVDIGSGRTPRAEDFQTIEHLDFTSLGRLIGLPDEQLSRFGDGIFERQKAAWPVTAFPEIPGVFAALAQEHTIGVVTASQTQAVAASLTESGLDTSIATVLGGELGLSKAERIAAARETYGASIEETLMTGDAISDVRQGKLAGVRTVAVTWGFQDRALLAQETPDFLIDRPEQLLDVVGECQR